MCITCEFPSRRLWTYKRHPKFASVHLEGWAAIEKCPECSQLWCEVAYEPHSAFSFWAAWPAKKEDWLAIIKRKDDGIPYYEWHEAMVVENYLKLSEEEIEAVEAWRMRAYQLTPIDSRKPKFCLCSADIEKFISE